MIQEKSVVVAHFQFLNKVTGDKLYPPLDLVLKSSLVSLVVNRDPSVWKLAR
jgi:hypothetical protein